MFFKWYKWYQIAQRITFFFVENEVLKNLNVFLINIAISKFAVLLL